MGRPPCEQQEPWPGRHRSRHLDVHFPKTMPWSDGWCRNPPIHIGPVPTARRHRTREQPATMPRANRGSAPWGQRYRTGIRATPRQALGHAQHIYWAGKSRGALAPQLREQCGPRCGAARIVEPRHTPSSSSSGNTITSSACRRRSGERHSWGAAPCIAPSAGRPRPWPQHQRVGPSWPPARPGREAPQAAGPAARTTDRRGRDTDDPGRDSG